MNTAPQFLSATTTAATTSSTDLLIAGGTGGGAKSGLYCPTSIVTASGSGPLPAVPTPLHQHVLPLIASNCGGVAGAAGSALVDAAAAPPTASAVTMSSNCGGQDAGEVSPGVAVLQVNAGIPGPIIIRNHQPPIVYAAGTQSIVVGAPQLPILKPEVAKQILLNSNTPRTLLKSQIIQQQQLPTHSLMCNQTQMGVPILTPYLPQQQLQQQKLQKCTPEVRREVLNTFPDLCATTMGAELMITSRPPALAYLSAPANQPIVITTTSAVPEHTPISSASAEPIMQISKDVVLTMTTSASTSMPSAEQPLKPPHDQEIRKAFAAAMEKQESLLKLKPKQLIVLDNLNVRANARSKSLQDEAAATKKQATNDSTERRLSTASDGKVSAIKMQQMEGFPISSSPLREENQIQTASDRGMDFDEYDEEEYLECSDDKSDELIIHEEASNISAAETGEPELVEPSETENPNVSHIIIEDEKIEEIVPAIKFNATTSAETADTKTQALEIAEHDLNLNDATPSSSFDKSLLCDEKILTISTSGSSNSNNSSHDFTLKQLKPQPKPLKLPTKPPPLPPLTPLVLDPTAKLSDVNSMSSVLNMLSNFNMLQWKERIGTARGTSLRFELNEFNFVQIHERCPPRYRIHTAYEKAIYERETLPQDAELAGEPLLYLCRRCNCHGPAVEFLAPEFCSVECLKRDVRKRYREVSSIMRKRPRKDPHVTQAAATTTHLGSSYPNSSTSTSTTSVLRKTQQFRWSTYLTGKYGIIAAPIDLFLNPFPSGPNHFEIGMKLEAIDPANCALFCVCSIVEIQGYRLKLNIDGYDCMHDFWVNADSMDIFPPGWCQKTGRVLQAPRGMDPTTFNWLPYLSRSKARPAHRQLFTHLNSATLAAARNPFRLGMQLEAEDLNDTGKLCVATICDTLDERVRVHFDGYGNCYDYWVGINSPYLHPCGWHEGRAQLIAPPQLHQNFTWRDYLRRKGPGFLPAPTALFGARNPIDFQPHMKLEVVDPRNPALIRPATVIGRKGHRVKLHLDCWPTEYCFWLEDDSPDLHPIGWCDVTGHDLEPPPGYASRTSAGFGAKLVCMPGCRGVGNAKRLFLNKHATRDACPYAPENWRQKGIAKPPRLIVEEIVRRPTVLESGGAKSPAQSQLRQYLKTSLPPAQSQPSHMSEQQILERLQILDHIETRGLLKQELPSALLHDANRRVVSSENANSNNKIKTQPSKTSVKVVSNAFLNGDVAPPTSSSLSASSSSSSLIPPEPSLEICREFLCDYGPRLLQNYNIWQKNFANDSFDASRIKHNPLLWSTAETCTFVEHTLQSKSAAVSFAQADIDGAALLLLQQSDLTDLIGLKLGPAVKLFSHILQLRTLAINKFGVKPPQKVAKKTILKN